MARTHHEQARRVLARQPLHAERRGGTGAQPRDRAGVQERQRGARGVVAQERGAKDLRQAAAGVSREPRRELQAKQAAARSSKYDAAFEQARARRVAAQQESAPAARKSSVNRQEMDDLFADWDRANNAGSASKPAAQSVAAPKPVQARPAAPASKPVSSSASDEFSLDDILAEFK